MHVELKKQIKMLSIYTPTNQIKTIEEWIATEERLHELLHIEPCEDIATIENNQSQISIAVEEKGFKVMLDWNNIIPPYLFLEPLELEKNNFLAFVFGLLGNLEKTWHYTQNLPETRKEWDTFARILNNYPIDFQYIQDAEKNTYRQLHNLAIAYHYGYADSETGMVEAQKYYQKAIQTAPNSNQKAFTAKQYLSLLLDTEQLEAAEDLIATILAWLPKQSEAFFSVQYIQVQLLMQKLTIPYDSALWEKLKPLLWDTLQYYEKKEKWTEAGLLLIDATWIANLEDSFSEALGYINKAIQYLNDPSTIFLQANALVRKAVLLYTWSKNGNPQFYRSALETFQSALKIFTKEDSPEMFAEIHHHLGIIYSEMPDENKKRSVWAALSASSFKEALSYFDKQNFPIEYATICNNYANAMTLYPPMKKADNYAKALELYEEVLKIREAQYFPHERMLTLLNFLEASWHVSNEEPFNEERYADMWQKAQEIKQLTEEETFIEEANKHIEALVKLKSIIS
ncbi:MAG: hypothetical protein EAZ55_13185 [Cytophagales bacterium]|nr:MAG: hypothetical protein EAZ55_13185 [Cytophagales bacterium]